MKKKSLIWGIVIFFAILVIALLIIKSFLTDTEEKIAAISLTSEAKAEVFVPTSLPTISPNEKVSGEMEAPVKILVYEDYSSVFSATLANSMEAVKGDFGDDVLIAYRPYVIKGNQASLDAAMAINCVSEQEGDWQAMRRIVFQSVGMNDLNPEKMGTEIDRQGLNKEKFTECLTSLEKQGIMLGVADDAQSFSVYGAPTIFINNELVVGARPYTDYINDKGEQIKGLKSLIADHLK